MRRLLSIVALCAAAAGCEPAWSVQGHMPSADGGNASLTAVLRCPGEPDRLALTDQDGVFELGGNGAGPNLACVVLVSVPGRDSTAVPLRDACEDPAGEQCSVAIVEVSLSTH